MYRPPDLDKFIQAAKVFRYRHDSVSIEVGAEAMVEALKAEGKYIRLHRYLKPPGYKQPLRVPGWVVFIPENTSGDKGGEV